MKRTFIISLMAAMALSVQAQKPFSYTLKGTLSTTGFDEYEFPIMRYDNHKHIGKIKLKGNQFEYHGTADSTMYCRIDAGTEFANFIVEEGTIWVDMKTHGYPSGTPLNEAYAELTHLNQQIGVALDSIRKSIIQGDMDRETRIKRLNELEYNFSIRLKLQKKLLMPFLQKMPNLSDIYNTYKSDRFDMVTVMVWDRLEASKKMLKEFDVQWKSIVNVGMKPMELYGFNGIPRIMLIDPNGIILHNDLRGPLIREQLEKAFSK